MDKVSPPIGKDWTPFAFLFTPIVPSKLQVCTDLFHAFCLISQGRQLVVLWMWKRSSQPCEVNSLAHQTLTGLTHYQLVRAPKNLSRISEILMGSTSPSRAV